MASSNSIKGYYSKNDDIYLLLEWEVVSQSVVDNKTTINCKLWLRGNDGYRHWNNYNHLSYIVVDGVKKSNSATHFDTYKGPCLLCNKNFTIKHSSTGEGDFSVSAKHYSGVSIGNGSITKRTITLPKINRISKINTVEMIKEYEGVKVGYTKYNSSYKDNLIIKCKTFTKTFSDYKSLHSLIFTNEEKKELEKIIADDKSVTFSFYLKTYSNEKYIGSSNVINKSVKLTFNQGGRVYIKTKSCEIVVASVYIKPDIKIIDKVKSCYIKQGENNIIKS